jgi:CHAT domain-containing protein
MLDLSARANRAVLDRADPDALDAAALMDLVWFDGAGISVDRSISYLQMVSDLSPRSASALADLASAHVVRAGALQTPRDLVVAVDLARRALALDSTNLVARFDLGLALDWFGVDGEAVRAWSAFLALDSTTDWAAEARARRDRSSLASNIAEPDVNAAPATLAAYASRDAQGAASLAWDSVLGDWGTATLAGDSARGAFRLRQADAIAHTIAGHSGDLTLTDAVRAIDASAGRDDVRRALAGAHQAFATGRAANRRLDYVGAERAFRRVLRLPVRSTPLWSWASVDDGAALMSIGRVQEGEAESRLAVKHIDETRYLSLGARARWVLGTTRLRAGETEHALALYRDAARLYDRADERENRGAMEYLVADALFALGDANDAYPAARRALATLRAYRRSVWLYNVLNLTAQRASGQGLVRAAACLEDEAVAVADRTDQPVYRAEGRLLRARFHLMEGDSARAVFDVDVARDIARTIPKGVARDWIVADAQASAAALAIGAAPARAVTSLDSVVRFFTDLHNRIRVVPALVSRAQAHLAMRDLAGATADLDLAARLIDVERAAIVDEPLRASLMASVKALFGQLAVLRLDAGDSIAALEAIERGRGASAPADRRYQPLATSRRRLGPSIAVEYALIADTLLVWAVHDSVVRLVRQTIDGERVAGVIDRVRDMLELRVAETAMQPDLATLYDWLVRPVQFDLSRSTGQIVVIADGKLAAVPFAALYDSTRRRYLIDDRPLRFALSLQGAANRLPSTHRAGAAMRPLLIADPAFDAARYPGLVGLPGAAAEVADIGAIYPRAVVLAGPAATRQALERTLPTVDLVHYAGHALVDVQQPDRSFLLLAPRAGTLDRMTLTVDDIGHLDLHRVRLVVLSACETLGAQSGEGGGFGGLANAFLGAGAGAVVGSQWRVDDRLTRSLMVAFHRAYKESGDGVAALREGQLILRRSPSVLLRSPAAWAAFQYIGQ